MAFLPKPDQTIEFNGRTLRFVQHLAAKDAMVHAETGARATVYLTKDGAESWALKVFRPKFRKPHQAEVVIRLAGLRGMPGLRVAERDVVLPDHPLAATHRDLAFAQLMPWVSGVPWANILTFGVQKNHCYLDPAHAFALCRRFLSTMLELERRTIAHTDIASGNVLVDPETLSVELIDLEEMYGPGFPEPGQRNVGSAGYTHPSELSSGEGLWFAEADRFASTILAAEMLVLAHPQLAQGADQGGGYFDNSEFGQRTSRFEAAYDYFSYVLPDFADVFARAWTSGSVRACPRAEELIEAFTRGVTSIPPPSGPALVPVDRPAPWTPPVTARRSTSQPSPSMPPSASASVPPASNSSPPSSDHEVVVGWNPLGAARARSVPPAAPRVRQEAHLDLARPVRASASPTMRGHFVAPAQPVQSPVFEHGAFRVLPDGVHQEGLTLSPHEILAVSIERRFDRRDHIMLLLASTFVSVAVFAALVDALGLAFVGCVGALISAGIFFKQGAGRAVLTLRGTSTQTWEVPMATHEMAERAAAAVRAVMAP